MATTVAWSLTTRQAWGLWSIAASRPPADADGLYNRALLFEYYNSGSDYDNPEILTLQGIPYGNYSVYVYFSSDNADRDGTISLGKVTYDFSTLGPSAISGNKALLISATDTTGANPNANYAVFSGLSGDTQTVTLNIGKGGGIAAFQIVAASSSLQR